jgi:hypothetical protein
MLDQPNADRVRASDLKHLANLGSSLVMSLRMHCKRSYHCSSGGTLAAGSTARAPRKAGGDMRVQENYFSKYISPARPFDVRSCQLPVQYRTGSWFGLLYRVDLARARFFCDELSVEPCTVLGAAMAGVYAWEHRDTSLGAHAELGIGILVRRRGRRSLLELSWGERARSAHGMLMLASPVTTDLACQAGQALWGYPRYLTRMRSHVEDEIMRVRLGTELALELGPVRGLPRRLPIATFTELNGELLRTAVDVQCAPTVGKPSRAGLHLLGGDGRAAEVAQALGLQRLRPVLAFQTNTFRASLPAANVEGPASR